MGSMMPSTEDLAAGLPEELRSLLPADMPVDLSAMLGPMMGMLKQMGASMFAMQAGEGLAALAGEVLGAGDVGLPLTSDGIPTLLPENVAAFGSGLGVEPGEIALYLALREVAHQRLFTHVTWLGPTVRGAVAEYARGIGLDPGAMEQALRDIDMSNPANLAEALSSGVLVPKDTPEQEASLARLETLLALVEGWVDHVGRRGHRRPAPERRAAPGGGAGAGRSVGQPRRPSRPSWAGAASPSAPGGGSPLERLERARGGPVAMPCGPILTLFPGRPTWTTRPRSCPARTITDAELEALTSGQPPTAAAGGEAGQGEGGGQGQDAAGQRQGGEVEGEGGSDSQGQDGSAGHGEGEGGSTGASDTQE